MKENVAQFNVWHITDKGKVVFQHICNIARPKDNKNL